MSVQNFFSYLSQHTLIIVIYFALIIAAAYGISLNQKNEPSNRSRKILSALIFMVSIPGIMALIVVFYSLFFMQLNLLEVNVVLYFLPILSMTVTLFIISRITRLNSLPGFDRLSGLMGLLALTGIAVLLLYKLRFFVGFFASMQSLVIFGIIFYFFFKTAIRKIGGDN